MPLPSSLRVCMAITSPCHKALAQDSSLQIISPCRLRYEAISCTMSLEKFLEEWNNPSEFVEVKTSGSTGEPKRMMVEKRRMLNSARITCDFLGLKKGDTALLCMSTDYIAGKMMVVRSIERGLNLISVEPSGHPLAARENLEFSFAAMVPMQVYNSLQVPEEKERLMAIRHLIIGGGAIDEAMERELRNFPNAVWSTYGMTETLSHIALRRISGPDASDWYKKCQKATSIPNHTGYWLWGW